MSPQLMPIRVSGVVFPLIFILAACVPSSQTGVLTPSSNPAITPFVTSMQNPAGAEASTEATQAPTPTSTPQTYIIVAGDTLVGIAERYDLTLDEILAANPGVDARFLNPGQEILIPAPSGNLAEGTNSALATPKALDLPIADPACYTSSAGELRCYLLVTNTEDELVEALAGRIQLVSGDGVALESADATAPLNALPPGTSLPLIAYWPGPSTGWEHAQAQLTSAFTAGDPSRYLAAVLDNKAVEIAENGLSAHVSGDVQLPAGSSASLIWVLAVAYDVEDQVVGVRRWESDGSQTGFDLWVYTLATPIQRVDLLVEARP